LPGSAGGVSFVKLPALVAIFFAITFCLSLVGLLASGVHRHGC